MPPARESRGRTPQESAATGREERRPLGWRESILALACGLAVGMLYLPAVKGEFVWDDTTLILENQKGLDEWRDAARSFVQPGLVGTFSGYYRPVLIASYVADWKSGGFDPRVFHRTNVVLHALNTVLVWNLLWVLFRSRSAATFGALLFGVHPIQAQAVSLVTGRNDLLLAVPFVGALLAHHAWRNADGRRRTVLFVVLFVLFALVLWTKETGIVLPLVLLAAERLVHGLRGRRLLARALVLAALAIPAIAYLLARAAVFGSLVGGSTAEPSPLSVRLLHVVATLGYYARRVVLPWGFAATPYHDAMIRPGSAVFLVGAALCLLLAAGTWLAWSRRPLTALGLVLFVVGLASVSGLVPLKLLILEHRVYVPMVGVAVVAASLFVDLRARRRGRAAVYAAGVTVLGLLALITVDRIPVYGTDLALWESTVRQVPESPYGRYAYGFALVRADLPTEAIPHFRKAVDLRPGYPSARHELALALERSGRRAEAFALLEQLVREHPDYANGYVDLAILYMRQGDAEVARGVLQQGIARHGDRPDLLLRLGLLHAREGRIADAVDIHQRLVGVEPERPENWERLGRVLERGNRHAEAAEAFARALALRPEDSGLREALGRARSEAERRE